MRSVASPVDYEEPPFFWCEKCSRCIGGWKELAEDCDQCDECTRASVFEECTCEKTEEYCCVCLGPFSDSADDKIVLECKHQVHLCCYREMLDHKINKCPVCKKFLPVGEDRQELI